MLKIITYILFLLVAMSCTDDSQIKNVSIKPSKTKKWTYLFYSAADNKNIYDPFKHFAERVSSNSDINYLVLSDTKDSEGAYYFINKDHESIKLLNIGEPNMGDSNTLKDFIEFADKYFPAERVILALYNHGGGWKGTCWDNSHRGDHLTMSEIENAMSISNNLEIVMFTAPCYMSSIEAVFQIKDCAKYFIGSEDLSGFIHWRGMLSAFDYYLKENVDISGEKLSKEIIQLHVENINEKYGNNLTLTAIDLSKVEEFANSFNKLLKYYIDNPELHSSIDFHNENNIFGNTYMDLYKFLQILNSNETNDIEIERIEKVKNIFNKMIVSNYTGINMSDYFGLNIHFPNNLDFREPYYGKSSENLSFKKQSNWGEYLKTFHRFQNN